MSIAIKSFFPFIFLVSALLFTPFQQASGAVTNNVTTTLTKKEKKQQKQLRGINRTGNKDKKSILGKLGFWSMILGIASIPLLIAGIVGIILIGSTIFTYSVI